MDWRDEGVVIAVRRHGETSAIAELLTETHGRAAGLVRGGRSRAWRPVLQPGNVVAAHWRARLEDHLGIFVLEPLALKAGAAIEHPFKLAGLSSLTGLAQLLPEREAHPRLYLALRLVLDALDDDAVWPALYARWELGLLEELGFGLDLSRCAVTGTTDDLVSVSPRSGRAVSRQAAEPYRDRLLPLPRFLRGLDGAPPPDEVRDALRLTGHFLDRHVLEPRGARFPERRQAILAILADRATHCP